MGGVDKAHEVVNKVISSLGNDYTEDQIIAELQTSVATLRTDPEKKVDDLIQMLQDSGKVRN